jgi:hypothetical protein
LLLQDQDDEPSAIVVSDTEGKPMTQPGSKNNYEQDESSKSVVTQTIGGTRLDETLLENKDKASSVNVENIDSVVSSRLGHQEMAKTTLEQTHAHTALLSIREEKRPEPKIISLSA